MVVFVHLLADVSTKPLKNDCSELVCNLVDKVEIGRCCKVKLFNIDGHHVFFLALGSMPFDAFALSF